MAVVTQDPLNKPHRFTGQRLLLHNLGWEEYQDIAGALKDRPALCLTYDRGNLTLVMPSSPAATEAGNPDTQRLVLEDIAWQEYEKLSAALDHQHLRMTYDRGRLELMTLSSEHEGYKSLLRQFVHVIAEEVNTPLKNLGSTTYRRQDLARGIESDECFYIRSWPLVRGKKRIDLTIDPPPDLALEVDITHSSLNRLEVYAALRIPEVWRFDGQTLQVYLLGSSGQYEQCDRSPTFPNVALEELVRFLRRGEMEDDATVVRAFRTWLREQLGRHSAE